MIAEVLWWIAKWLTFGGFPKVKSGQILAGSNKSQLAIIWAVHVSTIQDFLVAAMPLCM